MPPPVVHTECLKPETACAQGYYCGPYGCTRVRRTRLHGVRNMGGSKSLTNTAASVPTFTTFGEINKLMFGCCQDHELPDACLEKCGFNHFDKHSIIQMALGQNKCPLIAVPVIHSCASQGRDHSECCTRSGVSKDCISFCQPFVRKRRFVQKQMHCLDEVELMKACFYTDIVHEIRKDMKREMEDSWRKDAYLRL
ncbi:unnamed protein product [Auanema sp. JU1783]|nr:unnamed protein product [Auanema sp. JU1783]